MKTTSFAQSDPGRHRPNNEDSEFSDDELKLYLVCDGMGGHAAGEVASALACRTAADWIRAGEAETETLQDRIDLVVAAVKEASRVVHEHGQATNKEGMGTTLTLLWCCGSKGILGHVGDSRLYLKRQEVLHLMTSDHTGAAELEKLGAFTHSQAIRSPMAGMLTRAIGLQPTVEVDTLAFDLVPGDQLLLCSDGLTRYFEERGSLSAAFEGEPAEIGERLIAAANDAGGKDNITVVIVEVDIDNDDATRTWVDHVSRRAHALSNAFSYERPRMRHIQRLMNLSRLRPLDPGEVLVEAGKECGSMFVVDDGELEVVVGDETTTLTAGAALGRRFLTKAAEARATVSSPGPAVVLEIKREAFWEMIWRHPIIGVQILGRMAVGDDVELV